MPPTPITATGKIRIQLNVQTLTHFIDFFCGIDLTSTPPKVFTLPGPSVSAQTICDWIWTTLSALYPSVVLTPTFVLYQKVGGGYIPVDSGTGTGGPGTNTNPSALTTLLTFTFRDGNNKLVRVGVPESSYSAPGREGVNATPTQFANFIASILNGAAGNIGGFMQSRDAQPLPFGRALLWTNSLSRHTRKRRGLL